MSSNTTPPSKQSRPYLVYAYTPADLIEYLHEVVHCNTLSEAREVAQRLAKFQGEGDDPFDGNCRRPKSHVAIHQLIEVVKDEL